MPAPRQFSVAADQTAVCVASRTQCADACNRDAEGCQGLCSISTNTPATGPLCVQYCSATATGAQCIARCDAVLLGCLLQAQQQAASSAPSSASGTALPAVLATPQAQSAAQTKPATSSSSGNNGVPASGSCEDRYQVCNSRCIQQNTGDCAPKCKGSASCLAECDAQQTRCLDRCDRAVLRCVDVIGYDPATTAKNQQVAVGATTPTASAPQVQVPAVPAAVSPAKRDCVAEHEACMQQCRQQYTNSKGKTEAGYTKCEFACKNQTALCQKSR
ncbi:hypothetical protein PAPYR_3516 [Paratrimastix pyriformis]|uniref:Uncharacterized protein n=1 Tax=Paratrimastix pyriformis TaxID=342808 RepID=A0ABQ8UMR7_9EUKA|nr:hypothetical protein PAPYR_3516 [Paratrimastix pyriformis]